MIANIEKSGKIAGRIYAISTIGGILSTLLLGFYLIPTFGLIRVALAFGLILGIIPLIMLFKRNTALSFLFILGMWGCPKYNVWQQELSGKAQLKKADPEIWGDFPAIDIKRLAPSWQAKFRKLPRGIATLPDEELQSHQLPEPPSEILIRLEKGWEKHVLKKR